MATIELNEQFKRALELMERDHRPALITGRAGTGKSTLLRYFRSHTKKRIAVLAPTGVAAVNIDGETIHSFFRLKPGATVREATRAGAGAKNNKMFRSLDAVVIDEISMVRADVLDCVDHFLRAARSASRPFGGLQIIMIGDLYQLAPVVSSQDRAAMAARYATPYFFSADVMQAVADDPDALVHIELEKVYRQTDDRFIQLLNAVRNRTAGADELAALNKQWVPGFTDRSGRAMYLTAVNAQADALNASRLGALPGRGCAYHALRTGTFPDRELPTDAALLVKGSARVMFLNNDAQDRWINGTLGVVTRADPGCVMVRIDGGDEVAVEPFRWEMHQTYYDETHHTLGRKTLGSFTQMPLRLAWATTIHKSQGKTFDRVVIDLGRGAFAAGQVYVALSRCRTLDGITLMQPLKSSHLILDYWVPKFLTGLEYARAEKIMPLDDKIAQIQAAIRASRSITITYLKAKDEKSKREIFPKTIEEMEYEGHPFLGLVAYCQLRRAERVFNVARILEIA